MIRYSVPVTPPAGPRGSSDIPKSRRGGQKARTGKVTQMSPSPMLQTQSSTQGQTQVMPGLEIGPLLFEDYTLNPKAWDELFAAPGQSHAYCQVLFDRLGGLDVREFLQRRTSADLAFIN